MYVLFDVLSDYSVEPVDGKSQFGDLEHAKKRAVKDNRGRKIKWVKKTERPGMEKWGTWYGSNTHDELINIISFRESNPMKKRTGNPTEFYLMNTATGQFFYRGTPSKTFKKGYPTKAAAQAARRRIVAVAPASWQANKIIIGTAHVVGKNPRKKNPEIEVRELILWAENDSKLQNQFMSIMKNLSRKHKKGVYDPVLAAKLWKYWIDEAVKNYNKEVLGGGYSLRQSVFSVQDRKDAARDVEEQWRDDVRGGEYLTFSNPAHRKKKRKKKNPRYRGSPIKQGMQLPQGRGRVLQYDPVSSYVLVDRGAGVQPFVIWTIDPDSLATYTGHYFKNLGDAVRKFEEKTNIYPNPARRKKKRAKKKANPRKSKPGIIFRVTKSTGNVKFYGHDNQGRIGFFKKSYAKIFPSIQNAAADAAQISGINPKVYLLGATDAKQTPKQIWNNIKGKAGRRRNPVGPTQREIDSAHNLFREFTGDHPERMQNVKLRVPKTGLVIGELDGVLYTTVRDGKTEKYQHDFKKGSRPLLASSHDGESLHILGGEYEFTERGIEDK